MNTFEEFSELLSTWFETNGLTERLQRKLYEKLRDDIFDAGASFSLAAVADTDSDEEVEEKEKEKEDEDNNNTNEEYVLVPTRDLRAKEDIWLVDHCCTFRLREFRDHLRANSVLRERLGRILSLNLSHTNAKEDSELLFDHMWTKVGSYKLPGISEGDDVGEDSQYESYWFIHDEVGSAITLVTDEPGNMKLETIPIFLPEKGGVFSAMWCVEDIKEGTIATKTATTVLENVGGKEVVKLMYASSENDASYREAKRVCVEAWRRLVARLTAVSSSSASGDAGGGVTVVRDNNNNNNNNNNVSAAREDCPFPAAPRSVPPTAERPAGVTEEAIDSQSPLRVFTDSKLVSTYLTDAKSFLLVDLPQEAHVVWIVHDPIDDANMFRHAKFISQFPEERLFTSKQGLLQLVQSHYGYIDWHQVSYDSTSQLREYIGDYLVRDAQVNGVDEREEDSIITHDDISLLRHIDGTNLWMTKPINLARSIDMTISLNLRALLKMLETGPKVVCKYITNCATLRHRKFDLRFIVAVRSFPSEETALEAYVYNVFWTRFALEEYGLSEFDRYEKHWTVMNYANPEKLLQMHESEFVAEFNAEYAAKGYGPDLWSRDVYPKILKTLQEAFSMVEANGPNRHRCRAMYGVDIMLREVHGDSPGVKTLKPSLLEITYSPDCHRACKYHPGFFNDIFKTLFHSTPVNMTRL